VFCVKAGKAKIKQMRQHAFCFATRASFWEYAVAGIKKLMANSNRKNAKHELEACASVRGGYGFG